MRKSKSAGAYLRVLRENKGYIQEDVAAHLGVVDATIRRWERGTSGIGAANLAAYADFVDGNGDDVLELLHNQQSTAEEGKRRASLWLQQRRSEEQIKERVLGGLGEKAGDLSAEDLDIVLRVIRQTGALRRDPSVLHILSDLFSSLADLVKPDRNQ